MRQQTGYDFSQYKQNTVHRRIDRRMAVNQVDHIWQYATYLQENPVEVELLFKELLIGVTSFFRDPDAFTVLQDQVIPSFFDKSRTGEPVRIWVPACATGEEAYSIAILLKEQMEARHQPLDVQLFATDIDSHAIAKAREGYYPESIAADVSPQRLAKFFEPAGTQFRIRREIREMIVFAFTASLRIRPFQR